MIMPVTLSVITSAFPAEERSKAIGIWTGVAGGGGILGMFLSALLVDVFDGHHSHSQNDGVHRLKLEPYGWRWFRVGAADNTLHLSDLVMTDSQVK